MLSSMSINSLYRLNVGELLAGAEESATIVISSAVIGAESGLDEYLCMLYCHQLYILFPSIP